MLHLIAFSPSRTDLQRQVRLALSPDDDILFIDDGVYHVLEAASAFPDQRKFVLSDDLKARALTVLDSHNESVTEVDYTYFVTLTTRHEKTVSWYPA